MQAEVAGFRDRLVREAAPEGCEEVEVLEGAEAGGADLAVRFQAGKKSYYEVRVELGSGELQAGFATESRVVNEAVEEMVLDNGGDLDDLFNDELADLGEREELAMEHFFERPQFRFITRLPLAGPPSLSDPALTARTQRILQACHILFQPEVEKA